MSIVKEVKKLQIAAAFFWVASVSGYLIRASQFYFSGLYLVAFVLWFAISVFEKKGFLLLLIRKKYWILGVYVLFICVGSLISIHTLEVFDRNVIVVSMMAVMMCYYNEFGTLTEKRILGYTCLAVVTLGILVSMRYVLQDPGALRYSYETRIGYVTGGMSTVYHLVPTALLIFALLYKNISAKTGYYALVAACAILLWLISGFMTAIIGGMFAILVNIFLKIPKIKHRIIILAILCTVGVAALVFSDVWQPVVASVSRDISLRINWLLGFLKTGQLDAGSSLAQRVQYTKNSAETFSGRPLTGLWGIVEPARYSMVGRHSEWIDNLARHGIVGNLLIWIFYCYYSIDQIKVLKTDGNRRYVNAVYSILVYYVFTGFFNPVTQTNDFGVVIYMLIPLLPVIIPNNAYTAKEKCSESMLIGQQREC